MLNFAFDCDGTLVDSEPLHNRADVTILAQYGIILDPHEHRRRSTGIGRAAMLRIIEQEHRVKLPSDIEQQIEAELHRLVMADLQPIASIPHVLKILANRGARLAVASNSHRPYIEHALEKSGLRGFFGDRIASADQVARTKPAPDVYLLAAKLLDAEPGDCIAIEDSPVGVAAAHAAAMKTIGFCPSDHVFTPRLLTDAGASSVITDMEQLLDHLGQWH
ncbi:MAG TPA: HAD family phosphatase [Steroidobacteraceae bacterium]|jgi:HAD superfamily hydrolase (TIGR01509 family)|nr:HAD family phosphatase [Steroidobacteraceae bacterium]